MRYIVIGVVLALSYASANAAAQSESAFTATGTTCAELSWQPSVLERFPNIGLVCQGVVEHDGRVYAQFKGVVQRRTGNSLYIRFEGGEAVPGGNRAVKVEPPAEMSFRVGNRTYKVSDALPGQDLTIHIPGDRFAVNLGDEVVQAEETAIAEVVPVTEEPAPAEETPPPPPAPAPAPVETPPPAPVTVAPAPKEQSPWLLIAGGLIVIIVIVVLVMRSRRSKST